MLVEGVSLLLAGLNQHLHQADGNPIGTPDVAILGNVAQLDQPDVGPGLENQVLLSLVNIEEEATLKNGPTQFREAAGIATRNRPVHLNLLLIFAANYANYQTALQRLGQVVVYFQDQRHFDPAGFPGAVIGLGPEDELSLTMELVSLTLEEVNHLWGALGGREVPFAAYRARLLVLRRERPAVVGPEIREIDRNLRDTFTAGGV